MTTIPLPDRPLKLSRSARPRYARTILGGILLIGLGLFLLVWQMPDLQRDWLISRNPVVVMDSDVQNGQCTTRQLVFTDCEARLVYTVDGQRYETDVAVMFVDLHSGDYTVDVVRSGDDPALATISIGLEKLWNRIGVLAGLSVLVVGGGLLMILQGAKAMRLSGLLARAGRFKIIPVEIDEVETSSQKTKVSLRNPAGPRPKASFASVFGAKEEPLILERPDGTSFGLAALHEHCEMPVLLDRGLMRLNLTESERQQALAALA